MVKKNWRNLFIALLLALSPMAHAQVTELPAAEQQALAMKVERYLNSITTMKAGFNQMNQDGSIDAGTFYLSRPGRLRFEYAEPKMDYIVADGLFVHYWDDAMKEHSNATIGSTLADFLLRKKIKLSGDLKVVQIRRPREGKLLVTLVQSENPEAGDLRLLLNETPMQLEKWRVTDGAGNITEVTLQHAQTGIKLDPRLFRFVPPKGYDENWKNLN